MNSLKLPLLEIYFLANGHTVPKEVLNILTSIKKDLQRLIEQYPDAEHMNEIKSVDKLLSYLDSLYPGPIQNGKNEKLDILLILIDETLGFIRFKVDRHATLGRKTQVFTKSDEEDLQARFKEIEKKVNQL